MVLTLLVVVAVVSLESDGLVVTKDSGTCVTGSCCVCVARGVSGYINVLCFCLCFSLAPQDPRSQHQEMQEEFLGILMFMLLPMLQSDAMRSWSRHQKCKRSFWVY